MKRNLLCLLLFCGVQQMLFAQFNQGKLGGFPLAFYSPDTRWGLGLAGLNTFKFSETDTLSFPSQVQFIGAYTQNDQILVYLPFNLYFQANTYQVRGEIGYYDYLYYFFGIGKDQGTNIFQETYTVRFPRIRLDAIRQFRRQQFIGFSYALDDFHIKETQESGQLRREDITGSRGGRISGLGILFRYDSRDNIFWPSEGEQFEARVQTFNKALGSEYDYSLIGLDYRAYHQNNAGIVAYQLFMDVSFGDTPFFQLPGLGGPKRLRAYYQDQFRDIMVSGAQLEYRSPAFFRNTVAMVLFGGIGHENELRLFSFRNTRYSYGIGTRIRINKKDKVHIRIDYGIGKENSGVYLTLGEAF